jgi:hypothetical protein
MKNRFISKNAHNPAAGKKQAVSQLAAKDRDRRTSVSRRVDKPLF